MTIAPDGAQRLIGRSQLMSLASFRSPVAGVPQVHWNWNRP
jgi:hypothetical protein